MAIAIRHHTLRSTAVRLFLGVSFSVQLSSAHLISHWCFQSATFWIVNSQYSQKPWSQMSSLPPWVTAWFLCFYRAETAYVFSRFFIVLIEPNSSFSCHQLGGFEGSDLSFREDSFTGIRTFQGLRLHFDRISRQTARVTVMGYNTRHSRHTI